MTKKYLKEDAIILFYSIPFKTNRRLKLHSSWDELNWKYIFHTATINNVEYLLFNNLIKKEQNNIPLKIMHKIIKLKKLCDYEMSKSFFSFSYINETFKKSNIPFLVFKSIAPYNFVRDDIDILVRSKIDFQIAKRILVMDGFHGSDENNLAIHFDKENQLQIDLHPQISWNMFGRSGNGFHLLDEDNLWSRKREADISGISVYVPSVEDDILILCAHSIFQHHYITLNEVFHIGELIRLSPNIDWNYIFSSANKFGWTSILCFTLFIIYQKYTHLYIKEIIPELPLNYVKQTIQEQISNKTINTIEICVITYMHPISLTINLFFHKIVSDYKRSDKAIYRIFFEHLITLLLTIYRNFRYRHTKRLSFNLDWLEKYIGDIR